jgi:hypothetical protein
MLLLHCDLLDASRAACTAGKSSAIKTPMIAITTKSSTRVKPQETKGGLGEIPAELLLQKFGFPNLHIRPPPPLFA